MELRGKYYYLGTQSEWEQIVGTPLGTSNLNIVSIHFDGKGEIAPSENWNFYSTPRGKVEMDFGQEKKIYEYSLEELSQVIQINFREENSHYGLSLRVMIGLNEFSFLGVQDSSFYEACKFKKDGFVKSVIKLFSQNSLRSK